MAKSCGVRLLLKVNTFAEIGPSVDVQKVWKVGGKALAASHVNTVYLSSGLVSQTRGMFATSVSRNSLKD